LCAGRPANTLEAAGRGGCSRAPPEPNPRARQACSSGGGGGSLTRHSTICIRNGTNRQTFGPARAPCKTLPAQVDHGANWEQGWRWNPRPGAKLDNLRGWLDLHLCSAARAGVKFHDGSTLDRPRGDVVGELQPNIISPPAWCAQAPGRGPSSTRSIKERGGGGPTGAH